MLLTSFTTQNSVTQILLAKTATMIKFSSRALFPIFIVLVASLLPLPVVGKKAILIAGNFSIDGVQYNIAEFDPVADT